MEHRLYAFSFLPPLPVSPISLGPFNVFRLSGLITTTKQDDECRSVPPAIDPVSGALIDAKLDHSLADRFAIAECPSLDLANPSRNSGLCAFIAEALEPLIEWALARVLPIDDQVEHRASVA
jgi:hypothetical protein